MASPLRNQYALTDSGWAQATGNPVVELSNPVVSEAAPTPSAPAPVRVATKAPVSGSSVAFRQGATHSDPYILSLQIAKSPCFGVAYSSRAKTCAGCPVAALCQSARTARLSDLAAQLQRMAASTGSVEVGSVLWAIAEDLKKSLDDLKKHLREEALQVVPTGESGTEKFNGLQSGSAKVVVPSESVKPRKGADIGGLKMHPSFTDVFEEVTTFKARRNAAEVVAGLPHGDERTAMLESLDIVNGTPRVSFMRTGG